MSSNGQPCCGPCQGRNFCTTDIACCLECHMSMEENKCAPYLSPQALTLLKQEHRRIAANGFQRADLERHSQWEEALFRQYGVPPHILHQIHTDHAAFENGRLRSRIGA